MLAFLAMPAAAQLDTHATGMSDIWQRQFHHGQFFDPTNPAHALDADPDGDAWSNRVEAIAGTDPFKRQPPDGIVQCTVSGPLDARVLSWPVVPGKRYTAQHSASLATDSWQAIAPAFTAMAGQTEASLPVPPHLLATSAFFRIAVQDTDDDLDGLTNYEELRYGTDPTKRWSLPGIGDYWLASHFADPATCDPAASPHGDGYTHSYYYQFNLDPEYQVGQQPSPQDVGYSPAPEDGDIGFETILNGDFISPQIGTGKRSDKASPKWDYWAEVPNWTAVNGKTADNKSYIEFQNHQDISGGVPYCELEAEPMSHTGIKQTIGVVPGKTYLITLDYRDRPSFQRPSGVDLAIDNLKQLLSDIETVDGWTKKLTSFTAPQDKETVVIKITPPAGGTGFVKAIRLLPVEVAELAPLVRDENGNEDPFSMLPNKSKPLTPFVELNPVTDRIAHRELKVKISEALKGKTVTWTLDAVPDATPATIRGRWNHSTTHPDRFETSTAYGANGFTRLSQESGRTTVANDGFTAIRVNVPPVGFNQVRIKIQIEGMSTPMDLIDMEVPGVVVIDPGHGGTTNLTGSSWNNAKSPSGVLEKAMALNYGLALRDAMRAVRNTDRLNLKIFMTRETDQNVTGAMRAAVARDNGADVINIIHFNASAAHTARGTLEVYRTTSNVFPQQDTILSEGIISRMVTAMTPFDAGANHRARVAYDSAVASDGNNGNTTAYCPVRTSYIEVEFIDFGAQTTDRDNDAVDILLNTGPNAGAVKTAIANAMRDGILHDLRNHQPQP